MEFGAYIQNNKNVLGKKSVLGHFLNATLTLYVNYTSKKAELYRFVYKYLYVFS